MSALFIPTYFSPIVQYAAMVQQEVLIFEVCDNFQKQSYRNRCYIYGANGKQLLNIAIEHDKNAQRKQTKDTKIDSHVPWQQQHFKSLKIAYRSSPFFEFYEDDIAPIFTKKYIYLQDLAIDTFEFINDALELDLSYVKTTDYEVQSSSHDFRMLADAKKPVSTEFPKYVQVFDDKHGFIENLSILDLLFMEGPNTISYLRNLSVHL